METTQEMQDILTRIQRAKTDCAPWHDRIKARRKLYSNDHYATSANAGENRYIDPTYMNTVDLSVGILLGNEMKWHAIGWKQDAQGQITSDRIEKFLNGTIKANNMREEYDIPYEIYQHFVRDGIGIIYSTWDKKIANRAINEVEEVDEDE